MYEIKPKYEYENFSKSKKIFDFSNYSANSKVYDNSNKLAVVKIKNEGDGVGIKEFFKLNQKINSFLVDDSSDYEKRV